MGPTSDAETIPGLRARLAALDYENQALRRRARRARAWTVVAWLACAAAAAGPWAWRAHRTPSAARRAAATAAASAHVRALYHSER